MPELPSKEILDIISFMLPGFVAAWVFHGLTPHPKQRTFERVIEALIFLSIVQGIVAIARMLYPYYYEKGTFTWQWTEQTDQWLPPLIAVIVGLVFATLANNDWLHFVLRKLRVTRRTSYPTNWYSAFKLRRNVTLHLKNGQRVYGWPWEFPDQSKSDHFVLINAFWVPDEGDAIPLPLVDRLLIPASEVRLVELMKMPPKTQEESNGQRSTAAPTETESTVRIDTTAPKGLATATAPQEVNHNRRRKRRRKRSIENDGQA